MKTALINGSPKVKGSASGILLEDLKAYLQETEAVDYGFHTAAAAKEMTEVLNQADALVLQKGAAGNQQAGPASPEDDFPHLAQTVVEGSNQIAEGIHRQQHKKAEHNGQHRGSPGGGYGIGEIRAYH